MHPESPRPLQQSDLHRLDQFLRSEACGNQAMSLSYAHGFMTSVASGPEPLGPDEWLRLMFDEPVFRNAEDGSEMLGLAVRLYAEIERGLSGDMMFRPVLDIVRSKQDPAFADAQRWCLGFVEGLRLFNEHWTPDARQSLLTPLEVLFQLAEIRGLPSDEYQHLCEVLPETAKAIFGYWRQLKPAG
jgi:uncharacterized protein